MNPPTSQPKPVVLMPACHEVIDRQPNLIVRSRYAEALALAGCRALIVPDAQPSELDEILDLADGVLLTGSPSNVHPDHFGEAVHDPSLPLDPVRDLWTLPLARRAVERGIPLFAICRGFQEMNVAFGGSLHQAIHELEGHADHRGSDADPPASKYAPAHEIAITAGGLLEGILGQSRIMVNTVHGQGVNRLGAGLRAEAVSPDGIVEGITCQAGPGFNLGVQWHPEWQAAENSDSMKILTAFGDACRNYQIFRRCF